MRMRVLKMLCLLLCLATVLTGALAEAALPEGEFAPDGFTFSGGSGKVTITCPTLTVSGGAATATLVFSSPNYPRVVVDGVEYTAEHDGDNSVFTVPVRINEDMTVVGTTTAMSQPHDIEYTIHIYMGEAVPEAEAEEDEAVAAPAAGSLSETAAAALTMSTAFLTFTSETRPFFSTSSLIRSISMP